MAFKTDSWAAVEAELHEETAPRESTLQWTARKRAEAAADREKIRRRLEDEGEFKFASELAGCGLPMPLVCTHCGNHHAVETQCRRRWCPACAYSIGQKRLRRFSGAVDLMRWPAMVTLTRKNSSDPETLRTFRGEWAKMRRRKIIKDKIKGGVVGVEITNTGEGWHPHLHAIIDCEWLAIHTPAPLPWDNATVFKAKCQSAQAELSWLWGSVCKQENSVVWINRLQSMRGLVYALQYSIAPVDLIESPEPIGPMLRVIQKSRLVSAFGSLYGRTAEMDGDEKPVMVCDQCGAEKTLCPAAVIYQIARVDPEKKLPSMLRKDQSAS